MISFKKVFNILKATASDFGADNGTKLSASLAYYTIFSIGPLLLVVISLVGLFFQEERITGELYSNMRSFLGKDGTEYVVNIINNMQQQNSAAKYSIIGFAVLIFSASSVFLEIQTSINYIWAIKAKPKKGWLQFIKNRLLSFSLIIGIGFLLVVTLIVNTLIDVFTQKLLSFLGDADVLLIKVVNFALLFGIIFFLFAVVYKVLPDAVISWKDAFIGSLVTSIMFILGKFGISLYLSQSNFSTYGAAASVILLLTWVYYSSIILYFGAEFTKVYARNLGHGIKPYKTAVFILKSEAQELPDMHPNV